MVRKTSPLMVLMAARMTGVMPPIGPTAICSTQQQQQQTHHVTGIIRSKDYRGDATNGTDSHLFDIVDSSSSSCRKIM
jgi:hypothetical protein